MVVSSLCGYVLSTYRYGKIHSTERLLGDLLGYTKGIKDNGFTEPPQCNYCKVKGDTII